MSEVVLAIGAQDSVMDGVFCTVAVTRTAARSEEDWAMDAAVISKASERVRERSMLKRFGQMVVKRLNNKCLIGLRRPLANKGMLEEFRSQAHVVFNRSKGEHVHNGPKLGPGTNTNPVQLLE